MKNQLNPKIAVTIIPGLAFVLISGCATQSGGNNALNTVDSGLASIEQSAQMSRQAIATGSAAASNAEQSAQQIGDQAVTAGKETLSGIEQSARQIGDGAMAAGSAAASGMTTLPGTPGQGGLVEILMQQLGVSQQQALGGSGAIFQMAQAGMSPQAFSTLSQSVPGMTEMLNAAPVVSNPLTSMGSGISGMLGNTGAGATLNNAAALASSFQQLNLSPDMVGQFVPIVTNYVRTTSGQLTADLLNSALSVR